MDPSPMPPLGLCLPPNQLPAGTTPDFLELNVQVFLQPLAPAEIFEPARADLARTGLPARAANCFLPAGLPCVGPRVDLGAIEHYAQTAFRRARACGLGIIVFGSGYARAVPDGFPRARAAEQFIECLRRLAPLAAAEQVRIAIEPLNYQECNFINSLAEGAEYVRRAEHPAVRLLADTYHMGRDGDPPRGHPRRAAPADSCTPRGESLPHPARLCRR